MVGGDFGVGSVAQHFFQSTRWSCRTAGIAIVWLLIGGLLQAQSLQPRFLDALGEPSLFNTTSSDGPLTVFDWSGSPSEPPDPDAPIATDRPDFTEASSTVGLGVLQIESGYTYAFDDDGTVSTKTHSYPEALFRYGVIGDWLELRLAANVAGETVAVVQNHGATDLYLGAKLALTLQSGILPEMALVPQMLVPTGDSAFTADEVLPGLNWLYGWDVTDCLTTAGSTQFNRRVDDGTGDAYTEWAQSWTVGYSLHDQIGAYTEWFALFPTSADTACVEHYADGGLTFQFTPDLQLDVRAGVGLNDAAADYFVGTGLSVRFR